MCEMGEQSNNDYLNTYRKFFEYFESSVDPKDQLPVKVAGYNVAKFEIPGEVADWALQYLNERKCPPNLVAPIIRTLLDEINQKCKAQPGDCGYRPQKDDYQSLKLMKAATNQLIDVCKRYLNNAQLSTLPSPPSAILQAPPVSSCGIKNTRRTMEDRHIALQDLHTLFNIKGYGTASYYAVFDGHNGTDAAVYSVSHLHQFLMESEHYPDDPITALQDAFLKTDDYFKEKCTEDGLKSGTTVVCCLLRPKEQMLYVAWAGDSQAVLVKHGVSLQIVRSHKPDRPDERSRIEDMGGSVLHWGVWRVNGQIAVSRAIGDQMCKPFVIADPEIKAIPLDGTEDFLILACDGLWDVVGEDQAMFAVYDYLRDSPGDLEGVSQRLVQLAKEEGSTDNISVVVVFLSEPSEVVKRRPMETASPPNPFLKQNGSELFCGGQQNGSLRIFQQDEEEEDFGPETDVDAVDDVLMQPSAIAAAKALVSSQNKELEDDLERQRQQLSEFDDPADADRSTNTPTPPACDVVGLAEAENVAESGGEGDDSDEEEWNYIKGEEKTSRDLTKEELEDMESQLNPDAPVFIPECPSIAVNPKLNDIDISSSPMKGSEKSLDNVSLPTQNDFHKGIIECAGEFNRHNGVDLHNTEQFDEKQKNIFNQADESEILSTKAEYGDDSAFSFSNSMNTSTAFSADITHDDKGSSDMLNAIENDFDPSMDAPKELQDLVSSPEPDESLVPGTPRSTIAEASVSPANIDISPSQFVDLERSSDIVKGEHVDTKETLKKDTFFNEQIDDICKEKDSESQKPLTFAEVLKRPSPRTSPEPPLEPPVTEEIVVEEEIPLTDTNPFVEEVKVEPVVEDPIFDVELVKPSLLPEDIEIAEFDTTQERNESSEPIKDDEIEFSDIKQDIINKSVDDELSHFGGNTHTIHSPFVTVRKSPLDENLVDFDKLRSPEDEKPPQFFQVDDNAQHFDSVEQKIDDLPNFDNFEHDVKASLPQEDLISSLMADKAAAENIQFISIHSESSVVETEIPNNLRTNTEQIDDVSPGDLQFGTINSKLEIGDDFNFSSEQTKTQAESKEFNVVREQQGFEVEENHFDLKASPAEVDKLEPVIDFEESHFKEEKSDILAGDSFMHNFESKFDAQDITLDTPRSEIISNNDQSVPPVSLSVDEQSTSLFSNNFHSEVVHDLQKPFDDTMPVTEEFQNSFNKQFDFAVNPLSTEISSQLNEKSPVTSNPFLEESRNLVEESAKESVLSQFESGSNFATEQLSGKEFTEIITNESVVEQKNLEPLSPTLVKQQEETLEQTINVDFIPAEPLATPESHLVSPTIPHEEVVKSDEVVDLIESAISEITPEIVAPPQALDSVEESPKDVNSSTGTPPPTPAPGVAEQKPEEKEGLLAAAAAAAVAGAAATAGVAVAAKTGAKKPATSTTAAKKTAITGPKKPADLKATTKTTATTVKSAAVPKSTAPSTKPAASTAARKSLTSTAPASKPATRPAVGAKTSTTVSKLSTATKPSTLTSKPSTPPSKPTTPTSSSRPSSATKTSPTKPSVTARSTVPAATKPKTTTSTVDKKPLTNGDISKTGVKKPESALTAKKPLTGSTASKVSTAASKPLASKTTTTSVTSKVGVSSVTKTSSPTSATAKPKMTTAAKPASTLNTAAKAKLPAKPTDKTVKETVNKQISSTASKLGANKVPPTKTTTTTLRKTETKTSPGKTAANKPSPIKKTSITVVKKEIKSEEVTQDHIVTTTNGFTEDLIETGVKLEKDSSPLDNNICDDNVAATN